MNVRAATTWGTWLLRPRSPQDAMLRPFEIGMAVIALLGFQKMLGNLSATPSRLAAAGLIALLVVHLLVALECIRPMHLAWPITLLTAGGLIVVVAGETLHVGSQPVLWYIDAWVGVPLAFLAVIQPDGVKLPLLLTTTVVALLMLNALHTLDWAEHIVPTIFLAVSLSLLLLARRVVFTLVDEQVASLESRQRDAAREAETRAADESLAMLRRAMHDSLLHCLQRIGTLWQSSSPEQLRQAAATTRGMLEAAPSDATRATGESLLDALRLGVADEPCAITWLGGDTSVPPLVQEAVRGAALEAVRNVVKHCDVASADIHVEQTIGGVRVTIGDTGPGFDMPAALRGRSGIRESIVGRMASVGGGAQYATSPSGTVVTLEWPAKSSPETLSLGRRTREALAWTPLPLAVGSLASVLTFPGPSPLLASILWTVLVAVLLVATRALVARGLTDREAWLLCGIGLAALIANYGWVGPGESAWAVWVPSLTACCIILALPGRSMRTAASMATLMVTGSLVASLARLGPAETLGPQFGAIMAILMNALVTLVLVFGAVGVSQHVVVTRQLEATVLQRTREAKARSELWAGWLGRVRLLADPFLADVAAGRLDPADPLTRREAVWLEARIRDELAIWPERTPLPAQLDALRRSGWQVRLLGNGMVAAGSSSLVTVLHALPPPQPGQELTISVRDSAPVLTFSNPALSEVQLGPVRAWASRIDPDFTQLSAGILPATNSQGA